MFPEDWADDLLFGSGRTMTNRIMQKTSNIFLTPGYGHACDGKTITDYKGSNDALGYGWPCPDFGASGNEYVNSSLSIDVSEYLTLSAFVRLDSIGGDANQLVNATRGSTTNDRTGSLVVNSSGQVGVLKGLGASATYAYDTTNALSANTWYLVLIQRHRDAVSGSCHSRIINCVTGSDTGWVELIASGDTTVEFAATVTNYWIGGFGAVLRLNGIGFGFGFWNRLLSEGEISGIASGSISTTGLVYFLTGINGVGTISRDSSGNGYHGTATSPAWTTQNVVNFASLYGLSFWEDDATHTKRQVPYTLAGAAQSLGAGYTKISDNQSVLGGIPNHFGRIDFSRSTKTDLVTNGDFDTDSDWILTDFSITGGAAVGSSTSGSIAQEITGLIAGARYRVHIKVSDVLGGSVTVTLGGGTSSAAITSEKTLYLTAGSDVGKLLAIDGHNFTGEVDDVMLWAVPDWIDERTDRYNETVFKDDARSSSYADSANWNSWHVSELTSMSGAWLQTAFANTMHVYDILDGSSNEIGYGGIWIAKEGKSYTSAEKAAMDAMGANR